MGGRRIGEWKSRCWRGEGGLEEAQPSEWPGRESRAELPPPRLVGGGWETGVGFPGVPGWGLKPSPWVRGEARDPGVRGQSEHQGGAGRNWGSSGVRGVGQESRVSGAGGGLQLAVNPFLCVADPPPNLKAETQVSPCGSKEGRGLMGGAAGSDPQTGGRGGGERLGTDPLYPISPRRSGAEPSRTSTSSAASSWPTPATSPPPRR